MLGLSSTASVFALIGRLNAAGYVERVDSRVVPPRKCFGRPLLGSVRAGQPQPAERSEPEVLTLDDYLIDQPNRNSLHKARGGSMRDGGILEGELVAVEQNAPTAPVDIVVALVDGEITVKTLRRDDDGKFYLEAANPANLPIRGKTSLEFLGALVSVCRRVRR